MIPAPGGCRCRRRPSRAPAGPRLVIMSLMSFWRQQCHDRDAERGPQGPAGNRDHGDRV